MALLAFMRAVCAALLGLVVAGAAGSQLSVPGPPRTVGGEASKVEAAVSASDAARARLVAQADAAHAAAAAAQRAHVAAEAGAKASAATARVAGAMARKSAALKLRVVEQLRVVAALRPGHRSHRPASERS